MQKKAAEKSVGGNLAKGIGCAYISAVLLLFVYSLIIEKAPDMMKYEDAALIAISLLSAFICGRISCAGRKEGRGALGLISGVLYSGIIIMLAVLINIDMLNLAGIVRIVVCGLVGSILGCISNLGKSNKKLRKRNKQPKRDYVL